MHNETSITYYCSRCRQQFSISVRLDGCMAPMQLISTHKEKCPTCGEPAGRAPFLGLPNLQQILLEGARVMIGRLPHDAEKLESANLEELARSLVVRDGEWLYLDDLCVSRKHAALTRVDEVTHMIEDIGSRRGTFVNDQLIRGKKTLMVGDTVRIGQTKIGYCDDPIAGR